MLSAAWLTGPSVQQSMSLACCARCVACGGPSQNRHEGRRSHTFPHALRPLTSSPSSLHPQSAFRTGRLPHTPPQASHAPAVCSEPEQDAQPGRAGSRGGVGRLPRRRGRPRCRRAGGCACWADGDGADATRAARSSWSREGMCFLQETHHRAVCLPLLCSPPCSPPRLPPCLSSHSDLTEQQVEAARNATRDLAPGGGTAAQPAVPDATPVTFAPAPLPEATARRLLRVSGLQRLGREVGGFEVPGSPSSKEGMGGWCSGRCRCGLPLPWSASPLPSSPPTTYWPPAQRSRPLLPPCPRCWAASCWAP